MEIGTCPSCAHPYRVSDVVGFGILRPRTARRGGPLVEYTCSACGKLMLLVPHGEGRYAAPGQPPPPPAPEEERRPPWLADQAAGPAGRPPDPAPERMDESVSEPREDFEPPEPGGAPLDAVQALALLGCSPEADRRTIERAFRERSLTCHPDKVAHLDPEFQDLAEKKFKRLQEAYDLLLS